MGGTASVPVANDPTDWDMSYRGLGIPNDYGISLAYDTLLAFKHGPGVKYEDLVLQSGLAERWEAPDAQTYTFHLRSGVRFADLPPVNGRALTATDVQWSYEYAGRNGPFQDKKLPPGGFSWFFAGLDRIETPDASTAVVRFKQPYVPFASYSASSFNPIVPHEIYDQDGSLKNRIVGTGPYQLDTGASQRGTRWVWKKNPGYWNTGKPNVNEIDWLVIPDDASVYAAFQTKRLDVIGGTGVSIPIDQVQQIKKAVPSAVMDEYFPFGPTLHINFNTRVEPGKDLRVRQAVSYGIDRDEFIKTFSAGKGVWVLSGAFPDTYTEQEIKQIVGYDPARAKQLVSAAGYDNGVDLECLYPGTNYGQAYISELQLLQAQLKKVGINLNLKSADKAAISRSKTSGTFVVTVDRTLTNLTGDVDSALYQTFHSGLSSDYSGANDPQLDALLDGERRETDPAKRKELVRQAVRLINEGAYRISVYRAPEYQFWQPYLKGYAPNFGDIMVPQPDTWLEK